MSRKKYSFSTLLFALLGAVFTPVVYAQDTGAVNDDSPFGNKFTLGIGIGIESFNTQFKITGESLPDDVLIDAEDDLGLQETKTIPLIYGVWRPSQKHGVGFSFFRINRSSTNTIDKSLGNLHVDGEVSISDKTRFYYVSYNYTLFEKSQSYVFASLGVYGLDLNYELFAQGDITMNGFPIPTDDYYEHSVDVFAPLPLLGIDGWFQLSPKWSIGAKLSLVGGSYNDVSAFVYQSKVRTRYQFHERAAFTLGVNYLDADIEIDREKKITDLKYGFYGIALGVDFRF